MRGLRFAPEAPTLNICKMRKRKKNNSSPPCFPEISFLIKVHGKCGKPLEEKVLKRSTAKGREEAAPEDPTVRTFQKPPLSARDSILPRALPRAHPGLTAPRPSQPSGAAGQLHPPHPGPASSVDPVSPLPRHTPRCLRRWKGVPPPSCPLRPATQVARAPLGPVLVEATRAPRGHLPRAALRTSGRLPASRRERGVVGRGGRRGPGGADGRRTT